MKYRVFVELEWFKVLFQEEIVKKEEPSKIKLIIREQPFLNKVFEEFSLEDAERVKEIERETNHDVKAIEYFLKEKFDTNRELAPLKEFLHFTCTSEDINNLSYALMLNDSFKTVILPSLRELFDLLNKLAIDNANIPMMARTHGQSATPTTVGKEFANFAFRIGNQIKRLEQITPTGKFNGAVGNLNAHKVAYEEIDWLRVSQRFVEGLGIKWNPYTT